MDLPNYNKKIIVELKEKDFYGFIEEEGEAIIEGQFLIITQRFNNRMTNEKGDYKTEKYLILEYFEELQYLKVEQRLHFPLIFDMKASELFRFNEYIRLGKVGFDEKNQADIESGLYFLAHHLVYLFRIDPLISVQILDSIYLLQHQEELRQGELRIYREYNYFYIHQINSYFVIYASITDRGVFFYYSCISYYYAGLKKYLEDALQGTAWKIM